MFLSVKVEGVATDTFLYVLLFVEHSINMIFVYRIFKAKEKSGLIPNKERLCNDLQALVLAEALEIIIPIAYLVCLLIAFYGPNAEILGNVKNNYWQFQSIDDITIPIKNILFLVGIDTILFCTIQ